ncbi:MAG: hypothetical protein KME31_29935 [Tolypothrix carrinoi HA7290-LM1]|jgi:citrate synthase|nr:hypothetical protein [Tolypothrix carrinoi HA7290-LM1]
MLYQVTDIDGPTLKPEQLNVRGKNLNEIIGTFSYTGAVYHLLTGKKPHPSQEQALDNYLVKAFLSLEPNHPAMKVVKLVAAFGTSASRAIIAGLMVEIEDILSRTIKESDIAEIGLEQDAQEGLYYFAITPLLLAYAISSVKEGGNEELESQLSDLRTRKVDYLTCIFQITSGRNFANEIERKLFNDVMVSFHAGFGFLTPTVMLPRGAVGTGVPIPQALAAGYTAAGPFHVGACDKAMELFQSIHNSHQGDLDECTLTILEKMLANKTIIPGFGHPLFKVDPRNAHLRKIIVDMGYDSDFIRIYDVISDVLKSKIGIFPNVDSISAAVFLSLGIRANYGTGLFLCSRTSAMIAHLIEKKQKPAFGVRSETARQGLEYFNNNGFTESEFQLSII